MLALVNVDEWLGNSNTNEDDETEDEIGEFAIGIIWPQYYKSNCNVMWIIFLQKICKKINLRKNEFICKNELWDLSKELIRENKFLQNFYKNKN